MLGVEYDCIGSKIVCLFSFFLATLLVDVKLRVIMKIHTMKTQDISSTVPE